MSKEKVDCLLIDGCTAVGYFNTTPLGDPKLASEKDNIEAEV